MEHLTSADRAALHRVVADLRTYPEWLDIVHRVEPAPEALGDDGAAFFVTLRARIGRLARAKRLRMVLRSTEDERVVFRRREVDGRRHSDWILEVRTFGASEGSRLEMRLTYTGGLFEPVVGRVLDAEIRRSRSRLDALLVA